MVNLDAALGQQLLDVAVGRPYRQVPADAEKRELAAREAEIATAIAVGDSAG